MKSAAIAIVTVCATLLVLAAIAIVAAESGGVDVAATTEDAPFVSWFLQTTRDRAVSAASRDIVAPADLSEPRRVAAGGREYGEMCEQCHGRPGRGLDELARGMNPRPPQFTRMDPPDDTELRQWFWVAKHGLRMTGMPSFAATDDDDELWSLMAFVSRLSSMSAAAYGDLAHAPGVDGEGLDGEGLDGERLDGEGHDGERAP